MEELRSRDSLDLLSKTQKINFLEEKVAQLSKLEKDQIPFKALCDEARINYENMVSLSYSKTLVSNFDSIDTLSVFNAKWNDTIDANIIAKDKERLYNWLKFKLGVDTLVVD